MAAEVVRRFVRGKADPAACEDVVLVSPHFLAVLDGVTARSDLRVDGLSGGRFLAELAARELAGLPPGIGFRQAVDALTAAAAAALSGRLAAGEPAPATCLLVYSLARREVWRLGDSPFAVDGVSRPVELEVDRIVAAARALALRLTALERGVELAALAAEDPGRAFVAPLLAREHLLRNDPRVPPPLGFGALDGRAVPDAHLEVFPLPAGARRLVLASDGYPRLLPTWEESEAYLREVLARDPLMIELHPSTKGVAPGADSFDDRAWLEVVLGSGSP